MWDLIASDPGHCLSFYFVVLAAVAGLVICNYSTLAYIFPFSLSVEEAQQHFNHSIHC